MESQSRGGFELACEMHELDRADAAAAASSSSSRRQQNRNRKSNSWHFVSRERSRLVRRSLSSTYASTKPYHQQTVQIHERS